jgi:hypothetical protein
MRIALSLVALLCLASAAQADLNVYAGDWDLLPNTAGQEISVSIAGAGNVTNATVIAEIVGTSPFPLFTGGDIVGGTIFASNNTGSPSYDFSSPQLAYLDVATASGTVDGNGILARLMVSTAGVTGGTFALRLTGSSWGDTAVGTQPPALVAYHAGSITVTPEPATMTLLLLGGLAVVWRKRR